MKTGLIKGFSLVEMLVVLSIISFAFIASYKGLSAYRSVEKFSQSQESLVDLKQSLIKFSIIHKYFPCPDSDNDGEENRSTITVGADTFEVCSTTVGSLPYIDLGLKQSDVEDPYGNQILYAINRDADNTSPVVICDNTSAASYFCNDITDNVPMFTLQGTPPTSAGRDTGDYYVCNDSVTSCSGTPANAALLAESASIVLVVFNEDGKGSVANVLASCSGLAGATRENCDADAYYHAANQVDDGSSFFDDVVIAISGYEIKSNTLTAAISWNSFTFVPSGTLTPTYQGFDLDAGDYTPLDDANNPDVILVNRNVTTSLDLGAGDDYMAIGNDLQAGADLDTGSGDDILYIVHEMYSNVALGDGDDQFVLGGDHTQSINADAGDDLVWIQGDVESGSSLDMGAGDDVLWLGNTAVSGSGALNENIDGGADFDIVVFENVEDWGDLTATEQARIQNFEVVIFSDDGAGNRNYHIP